jgi:hypothetical protein
MSTLKAVGSAPDPYEPIISSQVSEQVGCRVSSRNVHSFRVQFRQQLLVVETGPRATDDFFSHIEERRHIGCRPGTVSVGDLLALHGQQLINVPQLGFLDPDQLRKTSLL